MKPPLHQQADQQVTLSNEAWECIDTINEAMNSAHITIFLSDQMKRTQCHIMDTTPDISGDARFRVKYDDGAVFAFSLSDNDMQKYQPLLHLSICFGVAVKILGAHEAYARKIILHAETARKTNLDCFKKKHKTRDPFKIGRGLDFFEEVLGCQMPSNVCKPMLHFFFEMRNVAVHNLSRANARLCEAAKSEYIKGDPIKEGDLVEWSIDDLNQLHGLMLWLIPSIDRSASSALGLSQMTKVQPWYYGS